METIKDIRKDGNFLQAVYASTNQKNLTETLQFLLKQYFTSAAIPVAKHRVATFIRTAGRNTNIKEYQKLIDDLQKLRTLFSNQKGLGFRVHSMFTVPNNRVVLNGYKTVGAQVVGKEEKLFMDLETLKIFLLKEKSLGNGFSDLMNYIGADPERGFLHVDVVDIFEVLNRYFEFNYQDALPYLITESAKEMVEAA